MMTLFFFSFRKRLGVPAIPPSAPFTTTHSDLIPTSVSVLQSSMQLYQFYL